MTPSPQGQFSYIENGQTYRTLARTFVRTNKYAARLRPHFTLVSESEEGLKWLETIVNHNLTRSKNLDLVIKPISEASEGSEASFDLTRWLEENEPWCELLHSLACKATGLRQITLQFPAVEDPFDLQDCSPFDIGKDMDILRHLGEFQNLESMVIHGFYGKEWVYYLREKKVINIREAERDEREWEALRNYQLGTEGEIPEDDK